MAETTEKELPLSFESPDSASVEGASYDPRTLTLTVTIRPSKTYIYNPILQKTWEAFLAAPSKGKFFQSEIRPLYVGRRK